MIAVSAVVLGVAIALVVPMTLLLGIAIGLKLAQQSSPPSGRGELLITIGPITEQH